MFNTTLKDLNKILDAWRRQGFVLGPPRFSLQCEDVTNKPAATFTNIHFLGHLKPLPEPVSSHDSQLYVEQVQHQQCQNSLFQISATKHKRKKTKTHFPTVNSRLPYLQCYMLLMCVQICEQQTSVSFKSISGHIHIKNKTNTHTFKKKQILFEGK